MQRRRRSATSRSRPTNELAGAAGSCSRSSSAAGSARSPSWKIRTGSLEVLQAVLAEVDAARRRRRAATRSALETSTWPPCRPRRSARRGARPRRCSPRRLEVRRRPCGSRPGRGSGRAASASRPSARRDAPRAHRRTRRRTRRPGCRPRRRRGARTRRAGRGGARRAPPRTPRRRARASSFVDPSMSVKTRVTVPAGRSLLTFVRRRGPSAKPTVRRLASVR